MAQKRSATKPQPKRPLKALTKLQRYIGIKSEIRRPKSEFGYYISSFQNDEAAPVSSRLQLANLANARYCYRHVYCP
jgi:hypothetical protein